MSCSKQDRAGGPGPGDTSNGVYLQLIDSSESDGLLSPLPVIPTDDSLNDVLPSGSPLPVSSLHDSGGDGDVRGELGSFFKEYKGHVQEYKKTNDDLRACGPGLGEQQPHRGSAPPNRVSRRSVAAATPLP